MFCPVVPIPNSLSWPRFPRAAAAAAILRAAPVLTRCRHSLPGRHGHTAHLLPLRDITALLPPNGTDHMCGVPPPPHVSTCKSLIQASDVPPPQGLSTMLRAGRGDDLRAAAALAHMLTARLPPDLAARLAVAGPGGADVVPAMAALLGERDPPSVRNPPPLVDNLDDQRPHPSLSKLSELHHRDVIIDGRCCFKRHISNSVLCACGLTQLFCAPAKPAENPGLSSGAPGSHTKRKSPWWRS